MTIHPVRHSGTVLGVNRTMDYLEAIQNRITGFVAKNSSITQERFTELMMETGQLIMDVGTVVDGYQAVSEGLIDQIGYLKDALEFLYSRIEN